MKKLSPINFFRLLWAMVQEIRHLIFYWRKMEKLEASGELKKRGLRLDWIRRLYFVKNMEPEALLYGEVENGGVETFEKQFLIEALRQHNDLFYKDGSIEIVKSDYRRIKTEDYYAYIIWIWFRFDKLKFWNFIYLIVYAVSVNWLVHLIVHRVVPLIDPITNFLHSLKM